VYRKLLPAADSLAAGGLPLGLAHGVRLARNVAAHAPIRWDDVTIDPSSETVRFRREMEAAFGS
jgi:predicted homoserine dehydrogenase-like protein